MNISVSQPLPNTTVAIGLICPALAFLDCFCHCSIVIRLSEPLYKDVVTAPGYTEEFTHNRDWIFSTVAMDDGVFRLWPHFLSVDCRKSCSNFTSIWSRLFSYLHSCSVFAGFFRETAVRPWQLSYAVFSADCGPGGLSFQPSSASISLWLIPAAIMRSIVGSRTCIFVYLRLLIIYPP